MIDYPKGRNRRIWKGQYKRPLSYWSTKEHKLTNDETYREVTISLTCTSLHTQYIHNNFIETNESVLLEVSGLGY